MQKNSQQPTLGIFGLSPAATQAIHDQLKKSRINFGTQQLNNEAELEQALNQQDLELVLFSEANGFQLDSVCALIGKTNKDIPIIALNQEHSADLQTKQLSQPQVASAIPAEPTALAAAAIQRELRHVENRRRRRQAEFYLQEAEQRCRQLLTKSPTATAFLNKDFRFIFINDSFLELLGYTKSTDLLSTSLESLITESHRDEFTRVLKQAIKDSDKAAEADLPVVRNGQGNLPAHITLQQSRFERANCIEVNLSVAQGKITPVATPALAADEDRLTGLKNHLYLQTQLAKRIQTAQNGSTNSYLFYIQPSQLEQLHSDAEVDAAMKALADQLNNIIHRAHLLTRYQQNAFCVLFENPDADKAVIMAEQIHQAIAAENFIVNGKSIKLSCSIGVTPVSPDCIDPDMLLSLAITTASEAAEGDGVKLYGQQDEQVDTVTSEELQNAVAKGQLKLLFQPVVSLCAEQQNLYEVLLRMLDENNNQISPNEFINSLSHDDISLELDRWVISESINHLVEANQQGKQNRLFINLSGRSLSDPQFMTWLAQQLSSAGLKGDSLIFQIGEGDAAENLTGTATLTSQLSKLKAGICIKHFGSCIDSDQVLQKIDAQFIKLDGSFVQELTNNSKLEAFDKLIEPLKRQRKTLIAPLVENTSVISKLFKCGICYIQGYYLQAPREKMDYDFFN